MNNMKNKLIIRGLAHAVLVLAYTAGVAWIMFNGQKILGQFNNFTKPLAVLLLFVLSAAIVGALVLGKPVMLYLGGSKAEALQLFSYTLGWIFVITLVVFLVHL